MSKKQLYIVAPKQKNKTNTCHEYCLYAVFLSVGAILALAFIASLANAEKTSEVVI